MSIVPLSFKVQATLSAYRAVSLLTGTANSVKYPASASECPIGITTDTVLDTTGAISVKHSGIAKLYFNDTVTSGSLVAVDSSGRGVPHVNVTAGSYVIGQLVGPSVALTGTIAEVLIVPFYKAIP
jgi:hypothetical protein